METEQFLIRFYNTVRGVEFSMSFIDMREYQRAQAILIAMGLLEQEDPGEKHPGGKNLVLVDDEKFTAFGRSVEER